MRLLECDDAASWQLLCLQFVLKLGMWCVRRALNWAGCRTQNCTVLHCVSCWRPWKLGRCRRQICAHCQYSHTWLRGGQQIQMCGSVTTAHGCSLCISFISLCCFVICCRGWCETLNTSVQPLHYMYVTTAINGISQLEARCHSVYRQVELSKLIWNKVEDLYVTSLSTSLSPKSVDREPHFA